MPLTKSESPAFRLCQGEWHLIPRLVSSACPLVCGILLLFVGGMLYILYRPQTLLLFHVADSLGLTPGIVQWRHVASTWTPPEFVVYSLPAGLWATSYVLIVATLLPPFPSRFRRVLHYSALAFIPLLGALSELMQAVHLLPGTFDPVDLFLYLLPLATYEIYETIKYYQLKNI